MGLANESFINSNYLVVTMESDIDIGMEVKEATQIKNYDHIKGTYKPWYGLEFKVEYVDSDELPKGVRGACNILKRKIKVNKHWEDLFNHPPCTLYHEKQHADTAPLAILASSIIGLGSYYFLKDKTGSDLIALVGSIPFGVGISYILDEAHAHLKTFWKYLL